VLTGIEDVAVTAGRHDTRTHPRVFTLPEAGFPTRLTPSGHRRAALTGPWSCGRRNRLVLGVHGPNGLVIVLVG
jgi:hypothetical protein